MSDNETNGLAARFIWMAGPAARPSAPEVARSELFRKNRRFSEDGCGRACRLRLSIYRRGDGSALGDRRQSVPLERHLRSGRLAATARIRSHFSTLRKYGYPSGMRLGIDDRHFRAGLGERPEARVLVWDGEPTTPRTKAHNVN